MNNESIHLMFVRVARSPLTHNGVGDFFSVSSLFDIGDINLSVGQGINIIT